MGLTIVCLNLVVALCIPGSPSTERLNVGATLNGEVTSQSAQVSSPVLARKSYGAGETSRGVAFQVRVQEGATYTVDLRSYFFDSYLVLKGPNDAWVAEDDDSGLRVHSQLVVTLEPGVDYTVLAVALHDEVGSFTISLGRGAPPERTHEASLRAEIEDRRREAAVIEEAYGEGEKLARTLNGLANALSDALAFEESYAVHLRALALAEAALGEDAPFVGTVLRNLAVSYRMAGRLDDARTLLERSVEIYEKAYGVDSPRVNTHLISLSVVLNDLDEYQASYEVASRVLKSARAHQKPDDPELGYPLNAVAAALLQLGRYEESAERFDEIVALTRGHAAHAYLYSIAVRNLAVARMALGQTRAALEVCQQLERDEAARGAPLTEKAETWSSIGTALYGLGQLPEARSYFERALEVQSSAYGAEHPVVGAALSDLGEVLGRLGRFEESRQLLDRSLRIAERTYGPEHSVVAARLSTLGNLLFNQGKAQESVRHLERALAIDEGVVGPQHPALTEPLANLAMTLAELGNHDRAEELFLRSIELSSEYGAGERDIASKQEGLASLVERRGDLARARTMREEILHEVRKARGPDHPDVGRALNNLAWVLSRTGDLEGAARRYRESLSILERSDSVDPGWIPTAQRNLITALLDLDRVDEALVVAQQLVEQERNDLERHLSSSSESDALRYATRSLQSIRHLLACLEAKGDGVASAYPHVLRWKSGVTRVFGQSKQSLFEALSDEDRASVEQLRRAQGELSALIGQPEIEDVDAHARRLAILRSDIRRIEAQLQRVSSTASGAEALDVDRIASALPERAVWLDFLAHASYVRPSGSADRRRQWAPPTWTAWMVFSDGRKVAVNLGPSETLEASVRKLLESVAGASVPNADVALGDDPRKRGLTLPKTSAGGGAMRANREVVAQLWKPLASQLGDVDQLFIRTDGFLATLPFEILEIAENEFLIERYQVVYLSDPATLVRPAPTANANPKLLGVGAVDYDRRSGLVRGDDFPSFEPHLEASWLPLAETQREVAGVQRQHRARFDDAEQLLLVGERATEERLKAELPRHEIVHVATHGYFQPPQLPSRWQNAIAEASRRSGDARGRASLAQEREIVTGYRPGFLSGLVCAGANLPDASGRDNGLLTAEEVGWLDLRRCDLVVLSACQTALGTQRAGEGMMSLRRSFHQAGANTVISSLWTVQDDATARLMLRFYDRLWSDGAHRYAALRDAQLEMLRVNRERYGRPLPGTWGAFVLSGEWR